MNSLEKDADAGDRETVRVGRFVIVTVTVPAKVSVPADTDDVSDSVGDAVCSLEPDWDRVRGTKPVAVLPGVRVGNFVADLPSVAEGETTVRVGVARTEIDGDAVTGGVAERGS